MVKRLSNEPSKHRFLSYPLSWDTELEKLSQIFKLSVQEILRQWIGDNINSIKEGKILEQTPKNNS